MSKERMVGKRSGDMETDFHGGKEMGWGGANWVSLITSVLSPLSFQMAISCQAKFNPRVSAA